jgi:hypothetical protein
MTHRRRALQLREHEKGRARQPGQSSLGEVSASLYGRGPEQAQRRADEAQRGLRRAVGTDPGSIAVARRVEHGQLDGVKLAVRDRAQLGAFDFRDSGLLPETPGADSSLAIGVVSSR